MSDEVYVPGPPERASDDDAIVHGHRWRAERDAAREDADRLAEALRRNLPTISVVIAATRRSDLVEALRLHDEETAE